MQLEKRSIAEAAGTILMHNIADAQGKRTLRKGTLLTEEHVAQLAEDKRTTVEVMVLGADDVHEDQAAAALGDALCANAPCANAPCANALYATRPAGGRVNLRTRVDGVLEVDADRLFALNLLPGLTMATRRPHAVVGPNQDTDNVATIKVVPYAIRRADLDRARELARPRPGMVEIRPLQEGRRVALLLVGEPQVHGKLRDEYLPPTQARLERLGARLVAVEGVIREEAAIAQAAVRLAAASDLLIIAGQTSVTHEEDTTLRALRQAGARETLSGAPVEPGNLLALAYLPETPVLCAPGCAKGFRRNIVDLVLPRLLVGDRLGRRDIAAMGLGGFLTKAERAGDLT
jgi:molybdenum cofactor cytidylyltransferase